VGLNSPIPPPVFRLTGSVKLVFKTPRSGQTRDQPQPKKETDILFGSTEITAAINTSYTVDKRYGFGGQRAGVLAPKVLRSASRADMLRYVAGTYLRFGDYQSAHRAFFYAPNNFSKFCVLTDFLPRLGCSNLRFYDDTDTLSAPSVLVLTFRPSPEVEAVTGIRREVTVKELRAMDYSHLRAKKLPHFPSW